MILQSSSFFLSGVHRRTVAAFGARIRYQKVPVNFRPGRPCCRARSDPAAGQDLVPESPHEVEEAEPLKTESRRPGRKVRVERGGRNRRGVFQLERSVKQSQREQRSCNLAGQKRRHKRFRNHPRTYPKESRARSIWSFNNQHPANGVKQNFTLSDTVT